MSSRTIVRLLPLAIGAAALVVSCSDPASRVPTAPGAPALVNVEIVGPDNIPPGQSVQLTANVRFSDGTTKAALGAVVRWQTNNPLLLTINQAGVATAGQTRGEATVFVDVTIGGIRRTMNRTFVVVPDGTFRVVGSVKESDFPNPPIAGARVEVASGEPVTFSDSSGQYRLYGVPPVADILVSATGYASETRSVSLSANSSQDFRLDLGGPRLMFSGSYTLAIDVMDGCSNSPSLPAALRHRAYDATVYQNGSTLEVVLTEPRFRLNASGRGNRFGGYAQAGGARFVLDWYDSYYYPFYGSYPNIAEAVGNGTYLVTSGTATLTGSAAASSGSLGGGLLLWDSRFPNSNSNLLGSCTGAIQMSLTQK